METQLHPSSRWNPWPVSIIAFFAVAIAGCVSFVIFCSRHPADLVAADYYEQEMRYQGQLDRMQRAQRLDRAASVAYDAASKLITVSVPQGGKASELAGTIQLYRPSTAGLDRQLKFAPNANGVQTIDASGLQPGLWKIRVSWTTDNQEYLIDQRVVIGSQAS
ncbi:MAG TPA: FixH family protein [Candidatus Sulfotelmatobacter sp.]|nr:FixH family protein [Candidatus Sulfotelmatobacter sp.]HWI59538.1 FixH family protein [Bacillota bacterium]